MSDQSTMPDVRGDILTASLDFGEVIRCEVVDDEAREVELTFACETAFERWFGLLELEVTEEACDLSRLNNGAPLCCDHDHSDIVGVILKAWIGKDHRGYARARFSRSARASEVYQDVKDGIRTHISPGFWLLEMILVEETEEGPPRYRAKKWFPQEISIVGVAAMDELKIAAGVEGNPWRSEQVQALVASASAPVHCKEAVMPDSQTPETAAQEQQSPQTVEVKEDHEAKNLRTEMARQDRIRKIGARLGVEAGEINAAIDQKSDPDNFMIECLDKRQAAAPTANAEDIGMGEKDVSQFRLMKLIRAYSMDPTTVARAKAMDEAGFEREVCEAAAAKRSKINGNISLPNEVVRAASMTEPSDGGYLTDKRRGSMIDILTASTKVLELGARPLGELVGDVELPRMDAGLTSYVLDEDEEPTEGSISWGLLQLRAKTVGATAYIPRSMVKQTSYDAEMLYREEIARSIGLKMDSLCINGVGGRTQPIGILNWTGIGAVVGGTNGLAPTWDHIIKHITEVDQDNALAGRTGFLTNSKMRGTMWRTPQHATANVGGWIWQPYPGVTDPTVGMLAGYPAHVSNQVPSDLTKGSSASVCSAIIFANWNDGIIATWGGIDLNVDPYSSSKKGGIQITAFFDFDFAILRASSFAAMQDALEKS